MTRGQECLWAVLMWAVAAARAVQATIVHEVHAGDTAVLPCPSSDEKHRFQYWQLGDEHVIGPGNEMNQHKYKYDVWSGQLYIKSVSTTESGFYKCISKQLVGPGLNIQAVELIVKKDWEESWEDDSQTNTYRAVIGVLVLLILVLIGGLVFIARTRRSRSHHFVDVGREESPEESVTSTGRRETYSATTLPIPSTSRGQPSGRGSSKMDRSGLENAIIETDIRSSFSLPDFD